MHLASRLLFFIAQPSHFLLLLIGIGLLLSFRPNAARLGKRLALSSFLVLLVLGFSPLGHALLLPLENRFPRPPVPTDVIGLIILGGFEDSGVTHARGTLSVNESAERLTETVALARKLPKARIVFTGGVSNIIEQGESGAPAIGAYLEAVGIAPDRIILESKSRNTYENALFTRELAAPRPGERWLLITSAWHMPRAVGAFRRAGFDVIPWPVDYRTRGPGDLARPFDTITEGLRRTDMAVREWIGLIAYWILGRSDAVFPQA